MHNLFCLPPPDGSISLVKLPAAERGAINTTIISLGSRTERIRNKYLRKTSSNLLVLLRETVLCSCLVYPDKTDFYFFTFTSFYSVSQSTSKCIILHVIVPVSIVSSILMFFILFHLGWIMQRMKV